MPFPFVMPRGMRWRRRRWRALLVLLPLVAVAACQPATRTLSESQGTLPDPSRYDAQQLAAEGPWLGMRGRDVFRRASLAPEARRWYDRVWAAVSDVAPEVGERVASDDSYEYGRWLFQYDSAMLLGLRTTGDLRFLDAVDEVAQGIRAQLADRWCGGVADSVDNGPYGTNRDGDGFVNFRWRQGEGHHNYCRDTGDLDEALVHGHLAMVMYAYHVNRDQESPAGIDYAERADFWLDYLRNHFEAKWRQRSDTPWPDMDFIDLKFCHTYHAFTLYHYFVGMRLQDTDPSQAEPYLRQAMRLTDGMFEVAYRAGEHPGGFINVETSAGNAFVYSFGAPGTSEGNENMQACPVTYARYMLSSVLALRLEGFHRWDDQVMRKLARGLSEFVMDTDSVGDREEPFAAGVAGGQAIEGMPRTTYRSRTSIGSFMITLLPAFAAWDESGRIREVSLEAYRAWEDDPEDPQLPFVPSAMLFVADVGDTIERANREDGVELASDAIVPQ